MSQCQGVGSTGPCKNKAVGEVPGLDPRFCRRHQPKHNLPRDPEGGAPPEKESPGGTPGSVGDPRPGAEAQPLPSRIRLYEITNEYLDLLDQIEASGGELTEAIEERLNQIDKSFNKKIDNCLSLAEELKLTAAATREATRRMQGHARTRERAFETLRAYVLRELIRARKDGVETAHFTVSMSRDAQPTVEVSDGFDINSIPEEYRKVIPPSEPRVVLDEDAIKAKWRPEFNAALAKLKGNEEMTKLEKDLAANRMACLALGLPPGVVIKIGMHLQVR